jgi:hypothetical protein
LLPASGVFVYQHFKENKKQKISSRGPVFENCRMKFVFSLRYFDLSTKLQKNQISGRNFNNK